MNTFPGTCASESGSGFVHYLYASKFGQKKRAERENLSLVICSSLETADRYHVVPFLMTEIILCVHQELETDHQQALMAASNGSNAFPSL